MRNWHNKRTVSDGLFGAVELSDEVDVSLKR